MKTYYRIILSCCFAAIYMSSFGQNIDQSSFSISENLTESARAVVRLENKEIEVVNDSKMIVSCEFALTVLDDAGDPYANLYLHYDNHTKIKDVEGWILNSNGDEIKHIKKSDFEDASAVGTSNLFSDNRVLYFEIPPQSYPYTIKYKYEYHTSNTAFIPSWYPIKGYGISTEYSSYTLKHPSEIKVNFGEHSLEDYQVEKTIDDTQIQYELSDAIGLTREPMGLDFEKMAPHVMFASETFSLAGHKGQAQNWNDFGKWWYENLLVGTTELPQSTKDEIQSLVKKISDPKERCRVVYEYMQQKTRYISIQIGIGGWQPMLARDVDRLGYGDCKALTNYTRALLEQADVDSYYAKIYAGRGKRKSLDGNLVSQQSNHVILMVPFEKDTTWLECTNQKIPYGHLGSFTDDRDALVITPEGGKLIKTPGIPVEQNIQNMSGTLVIKENGDLSADIDIVSRGMQLDDRYFVTDLDEKDRERYYKSFFDEIHNVSISKTQSSIDKRKIELKEYLEFTAENFAIPNGSNLILRLNVANMNDDVPKRVRNRKQPFEIKYGFVDSDSVTIAIPADFHVDDIPPEQTIETKFGTYNLLVKKIDEHHISYSRTLQINRNHYDPEEYTGYRDFRKKIRKMDQLKIVLIKSNKS